ncbi:YcjX family protein [Terrihabitans rhizophilus]|uniref:YcjX family protein n=1 Tax=Terrihabitans rhizophilus TaxID=3092662 RepID=A0ABU4RQD7_9HYPH|nr:YcjX family protein [Terrihabitans sp. PJ23]MDX6807051.1 YcjX family protein [Terrihabitans sp. PJ23]
MKAADLQNEALIVAASVRDAAVGALNPSIRLGVTGLSRAGKTVFITALVNALVSGARLPLFRAFADGRLIAARLSPQPDDAVPRFDIETHLSAVLDERRWPQSTRRISELRIVLEFQSDTFIGRRLGTSHLTLDIVDYPGEWLLDLGLMGRTYAQFSAETLAMSRKGARASLAAEWHAHLATADAAAPESESWAKASSELFTHYLRASRTARHALSALPPGRFLLPGDLEGSPVLTFAPLDVAADAVPAPGTLHAMMARRYDSYVAQVVKPFFREHFARLDRQIVLVDVLAALDAGPDAVADLESALSGVLDAFRHGRNSWLTSLFRPRVDKILFAATKADHLHHTSHDRLEAILGRLVDRARQRASFSGAEVEVLAIAAVRATREASARQDGQDLPIIVGTPEPGERSGDKVLDGEEEIGVFPGDLPADPAIALQPGGYRGRAETGEGDVGIIRFRPPRVEGSRDKPRLPHIRMDRVLQFLLGDKLA